MNIIKDEALIRLFKCLEVVNKNKTRPFNKTFLFETIKRGFIFSPSIVANYTDKELEAFIATVEKEIGLTSEKMNASFHKSWGKVATAPMIQLYLEQMVHYITTYGFEQLGIYNEESVYIPNEKLEIPDIKENIKLVVIKGYTKDEIRKKIYTLLDSGIALKSDTVKDVVEVAKNVEFNVDDIYKIKNKEVRIMMYDFFNLFPEDPTEFLRYVIYKTTNKTLLIKSPTVIAEIKIKTDDKITTLFKQYNKKYGFNRLGEIFLRYKPLFLAFRINADMRHITNIIRKKAIKNHKPMKTDYLNSITAMISREETINKNKLKTELCKVNIFRMIRLASALNYRSHNIESIMYKIRNGKSWATEFKTENKEEYKKIYKIVMDYITDLISKNLKGKKIFLPNSITYALPATEKQFTGNIPAGSFISTDKDMIFGVHWTNLKDERVDIDLSMQNADRKIGWDGMYRYGRGGKHSDIMFSGDVTDAPLPKGASESFYVKRNKKAAYSVFANWFNMESSWDSSSDREVPIELFIAKDTPKILSNNYTVNSNNVICLVKTKLPCKQTMIGLVIINVDECRFYFSESSLGNGISVSDKPYAEHGRQYLLDLFKYMISLNDIIKTSGAKIVKKKEDADIDLSVEALEKDTIINLIRG